MLRRAEAVVFEVPGDRAVILNAVGDELITLNRVGTQIWLAFDVPRSSEEVRAHLSEVHPDVPEATLEADVTRFVDEMLAAGLLVRNASG
jgi:hypothetical protein